MAHRSDIRHRVRAARGYGDLTLDRLAEAAEIGRSTIVRIENGERLPKRGELREIALACGLPYEFFTVDFERLSELSESDQEDLAALQRRRDRTGQEDHPAERRPNDAQHETG